MCQHIDHATRVNLTADGRKGTSGCHGAENGNTALSGQKNRLSVDFQKPPVLTYRLGEDGKYRLIGSPSVAKEFADEYHFPIFGEVK